MLAPSPDIDRTPRTTHTLLIGKARYVAIEHMLDRAGKIVVHMGTVRAKNLQLIAVELGGEPDGKPYRVPEIQSLNKIDKKLLIQNLSIITKQLNLETPYELHDAEKLVVLLPTSEQRPATSYLIAKHKP